MTCTIVHEPRAEVYTRFFSPPSIHEHYPACRIWIHSSAGSWLLTLFWWRWGKSSHAANSHADFQPLPLVGWWAWAIAALGYLMYRLVWASFWVGPQECDGGCVVRMQDWVKLLGSGGALML